MATYSSLASNGLVKQEVLAALDCGYKHIDCAAATALRHEDVFLTSKLWNTQHHRDYVETACRKSLIHLGLDYLDLYLMHWPMAFQRGTELMPKRADGSVCYDNIHYWETWVAMENLVDKGLVRAIGLSNFNGRQTDDVNTLAKHCGQPGGVSQAELLSHCR
ncbi:aldo-keto reductase family 1 member A1-A-like [Coregonus clupeaformis]|uniref:aldo-keto reductase family 1 member A1-A-like n=1 Tax=Coregonus clupeaformis TaxID=59861 RepID=UPI001BDFD0FB|nr:aldo-keto reductase family 1 member A1-A-like [Coregonus clupeaformis]